MKNDLNDIARRIEKLEKEVFGFKHIKSQKKAAAPSSSALPDQILALRDSHFFKQPKTAQEIHSKL